MNIKYAVDYQKVSAELTRELNSLGYNPDFRKILKNIESMVTELSKLEVTARRTKSNACCVTQLANINAAIQHLEKVMLIAKLMK